MERGSMTDTHSNNAFLSLFLYHIIYLIVDCDFIKNSSGCLPLVGKEKKIVWTFYISVFLWIGSLHRIVDTSFHPILKKAYYSLIFPHLSLDRCIHTRIVHSKRKDSFDL